MKYLALIALAFTMNAHASGGFECSGTNINGETVALIGGAGHVVGNPLISDVTLITGTTSEVFPKANVVGYWNMSRKFKIAIADDNVEQILVKLTAKYKKNSDELKGKLTLPTGEVVKVECIME